MNWMPLKFTHSVKSPANGFTMVEMLIAIAFLGVIATMLLPKFIGSQTSTANANAIKQAFVTVGELCLRRQSDSSLTAIDWTSPTRAVEMCTYLGSNLNAQCTSSCLCKFPTGVEITNVGSETISGVNSVVVTFKTKSIPSYQMVIQPNTSHPNGWATRYTTRYAVTGLAADKIADVEKALNTN